jgi:hypothetical protein
MFDDPGAFVLSIEVPDEFALQQEARYEPPVRWAFREFWLQPDAHLKVVDAAGRIGTFGEAGFKAAQ